MGIFYNNTNVPTTSHVYLNSQDSQVVFYNNTEVWRRAPTYLYNRGDEVTQFTGGWKTQANYYIGSDDYCQQQTPCTPVKEASTIHMPVNNYYMSGGLVVTNSKVDLTQMTHLYAHINQFSTSEYAYFGIAAMASQPSHGQNTFAASAAVKGNNGYTSIDLNVAGLSGSYYVAAWFSQNYYIRFDGYIYDIQCAY